MFVNIIGPTLSILSIILGVILIIVTVRNRTEIKNIKNSLGNNIQQAGFTNCTNITDSKAIINN